MSKELKTGIVAVIIIAVFIWGYNFLKGQNIFDGNTRYFKVEYSNIAGVSKASLVTINGLKVGKVVDIEFNQEENKRGHLIVSFTVEKDIDFSKNSVIKIYSPSPLGGSNLAIIPVYDGDNAVSGDTLIGELESSLFTSIGERLDPLQAKLEHVMVSADSLFRKFNQILDTSTRDNLKQSVKDLRATIKEVKKMMLSVNSVVDSTATEIKFTVNNTKKITENLVKVSDTLANANIGGIIRKAEITLNSVNLMLEGIHNGKGTLGKLVTDDKLYNNLTTMSKELEELLREMKEHPKRFVHFSLFGKKAKPYTPNIDKELEKDANK